VPEPAERSTKDLARKCLLLCKVENIDISRSRGDAIPYGRLIQYSSEPSLLLCVDVSLM